MEYICCGVIVTRGLRYLKQGTLELLHGTRNLYEMLKIDVSDGRHNLEASSPILAYFVVDLAIKTDPRWSRTPYAACCSHE